jgi:hypothetical protein
MNTSWKFSMCWSAEEISRDLTASEEMGEYYRKTYLVGFIRHELLRRAQEARQADMAEVRQVPRSFIGQDTR